MASPSKKILFVLCCSFSALLLASVFYTLRIDQDGQKKEQFSRTIRRVSPRFREAVALTDSNPVRARRLLSEARSDLESMVGMFDQKSREYKELIEWRENIVRQDAAAYHLYTITDAPLFFDITLIKPGGSGSRLASYREKMVILDAAGRAVYLLFTDTKQAVILAGPDSIKDAHTVAIHGNTVYLLNADGIISVDTAERKNTLLIPRDDLWGKITALGTYGGNLYLLDATQQTIWKYIATEDGFSERQPFLQEGITVPASPDARMMIDGSIWAKNNTEVFKFAGGLPEPFLVNGMADGDELQAFDALYSSDVEQYVYVLDTRRGRVVVLEKSGAYQAQYRWGGLKTADDIAVSEQQSKMFVLQGSKIYAIGLQ